jgi:hypothetical protein
VLLAGPCQGRISRPGKEDGLKVAVERRRFIGLRKMVSGGFPVPPVGEDRGKQRVGPTGHPDLVVVGDDRLADPRF